MTEIKAPHFHAKWDRQLSAAEIASITANPWQMFTHSKPTIRSRFVAALRKLWGALK